MENASKALLISGGMLIAIILLSLFTYLMRQMGDSTAGVYSTLSQREITEFNQKFLNYEGKDDLTIQDVITIVNLAKDNNDRSNRETTITVRIDGTVWSNKSSEQLSVLLQENLEKNYRCPNGGVIIDDSTLLVNQVNINS